MRDHRLQVGVHHRRRGALVFLDFGQHLETGAHGQRGRQALGDPLDGEFVRRIRERVDEADRDGLDVLRQKLPDRALGVGRIERLLDAAMRIDALVHGRAQVAFNQRRGFFPAQVVKPGHAQRADVEHVAKPRGADEARARALAFQDRVRSDRRAVPDLRQVFAPQPRFLEHAGQAVDDRAGVVIDARRDLLGVKLAVAGQQDDIGERATDIDADAVGTFHPIRPGQSAARSVAGPSSQAMAGDTKPPRRARMRSRSRRVSVSFTVHADVSTTTP